MAEASAPAKIILLGEHAVVYGQPAIAVPVSNLRVRVVADFVNDGGGSRILIDESHKSLYVDDPHLAYDPIVLAFRLLIDRLGLKLPCDVVLKVDSDIPIASGLGSGAAVSTALFRAVCSLLNIPLSKEVLNSLVYDVEKIHHGVPSGIDNTVIVYESPVFYRKGFELGTFDVGTAFSILIGDTGVAALTRTSVGGVRRLYDSDPATYSAVFDDIGSLVIQGRDALRLGDAARLGSLFSKNHLLLQRLDVSIPALDNLVDAAVTAGAFGAKLSGGGRGGNMIAVVASGLIEVVSSALLSAGAVRVFTTVLS